MIFVYVTGWHCCCYFIILVVILHDIVEVPSQDFWIIEFYVACTFEMCFTQFFRIFLILIQEKSQSQHNNCAPSCMLERLHLLEPGTGALGTDFERCIHRFVQRHRERLGKWSCPEQAYPIVQFLGQEIVSNIDPLWGLRGRAVYYGQIQII